MSDWRTWSRDDWKTERKKQFLDQPLHFAWSLAASLPFVILSSIELNSHRVLALSLSLALIVANVIAQVVREILQWPSTRWWDPPLDWFFLALGYVPAIVILALT